MQRRFDQLSQVRYTKRWDDICLMTVHNPGLACHASPGQFAMLKASDDNNNDPLLRRPLSIHRVEGESVSFVYKVVGRGTRLLAERKAGESVRILGPLGKGYSITDETAHHILVGGGMGIAPLQLLAERIRQNHPDSDVTALLGARNAREFLPFSTLATVDKINLEMITDDGSIGRAGFVTELLQRALVTAGTATVYCCGPEIMMKKVAAICQTYAVPCQVSLEAHMACGIGACLGCVVPGSDRFNDGNYLHVCKDGPVFPAERIWNGNK